MKVNKNIGTEWSIELCRIEIKRDEYEDRIVRLIKQLIEIDQSLFPEDIDSRENKTDITREAA